MDTRGVDSSCLLPPDLRFTNERNKTKVIDESLNSLHNLFKENGNICRTALSCISDFLDNKCNPRLGRDGKLSSAAEILPGFHDSEDKGRDVEHVLDDDYARDYWDSLNLMNDSSLKSSLNEKLSGYDIDVENVGNQLADKFCNDE